MKKVNIAGLILFIVAFILFILVNMWITKRAYNGCIKNGYSKEYCKQISRE